MTPALFPVSLRSARASLATVRLTPLGLPRRSELDCNVMCRKHDYGSVTSPLTEVRVASPHASGGKDFNCPPTQCRRDLDATLHNQKGP